MKKLIQCTLICALGWVSLAGAEQNAQNAQNAQDENMNNSQDASQESGDQHTDNQSDNSPNAELGGFFEGGSGLGGEVGAGVL